MPIESMVDLTGGLAERYDLSKMEQQIIFDFIRRSFSANAFITCSRKGKKLIFLEKSLSFLLHTRVKGLSINRRL